MHHMMCKDVTAKMRNHIGLEGSVVGTKQLDVVATSTRSYFMHTTRCLRPLFGDDDSDQRFLMVSMMIGLS